MLYPLRKPFDDMLGVVRIDKANVVEPRLDVARIAQLKLRWNIFIETVDTRTLYPAAVYHESILYDLRQARRPCHLMHGAYNIEQHRAVIGDCVDAFFRPMLACWN